MRVAMVRLRALLARQVPGLPSEAVRADRDGTCRLETRMISSDVHQFLALCRNAPKLPPEQAKTALQQARALYEGGLLPSRGTRLYEWVDERNESGVSLREGYREEYYRATQRLARLFCQQERPDLAVPLYKGLLKAEQVIKDIVRELYRCYQQLGDLSSLIREDRHLRQSLREAYYDADDMIPRTTRNATSRSRRQWSCSPGSARIWRQKPCKSLRPATDSTSGRPRAKGVRRLCRSAH